MGGEVPLTWSMKELNQPLCEDQGIDRLRSDNTSTDSMFGEL